MVQQQKQKGVEAVPRKPITSYCSLELYDEIAKVADANNWTLGETMVKLTAKAMKKPKLGEVPRKSIGRPRKTA